MGKLIVISGFSGVGKGTVLKEFLKKHNDFELSISCTTRLPREGEIDGVNYFFITREDFETRIKQDAFVEWAEFSGNLYGTNKDYIKDSLKKDKKIILELDTQGGLNIKKLFPESVLIFILPPSLPELEFRLRNRNTETEENIQKRLSAIQSELKNSDFYDFKITNDSVENAVFQLEKILL